MNSMPVDDRLLCLSMLGMDDYSENHLRKSLYLGFKYFLRTWLPIDHCTLGRHGCSVQARHYRAVLPVRCFLKGWHLCPLAVYVLDSRENTSPVKFKNGVGCLMKSINRHLCVWNTVLSSISACWTFFNLWDLAYSSIHFTAIFDARYGALHCGHPLPARCAWTTWRKYPVLQKASLFANPYPGLRR